MRLCEIEDLATSGLWRQLWARDAHQHPWYLPEQLSVSATNPPSLYYLPPERQVPVSADGRRCIGASLVAVDDRGPVLGLPLSIEHLPGVVRLSAFGRPLYAVEDPGASTTRRRTAARLVHRRLQDLRREHAAVPYHLRDFLVDGRTSCLTEEVLRAGGTCRPFFSQMIDLTADMAEILADLRGSTRSLVHRERPGFSVELVAAGEVDTKHIEVLRALHRAQYGQELRHPDSWPPLADNVAAGSAFLLFGRVGEDYVSGAYFPFSERYCHYSIAANDPAHYGTGLSHRVLWRAIRHSRDLGCRWFEVGDRIYPGQHAHVAEKFRAISHFKSGFSRHVAVRLDVLAA